MSSDKSINLLIALIALVTSLINLIDKILDRKNAPYMKHKMHRRGIKRR